MPRKNKIAQKIVSSNMDSTYKKSDYSVHQSKRSPDFWKYFLRRTDGLMAQCTLCESSPPALIPTNNCNTKGLHHHLKSKHNIDFKTPNSVFTVKPLKVSQELQGSSKKS
ncbi:unnamed protein product, partial [Allacma fusca]